MKNIANFLTFLRIILASVLLLFFHKISTAFMIIFVIAMLTDLFDGIIARKTGTTSKKGALLDTIADFLLDASLTKTIFSAGLMTKSLTIWLIAALGIGALSPFINFIKHKKIFFIHSIPCKVCMWALIGIPFSACLGFSREYISFTLALITFAMIDIVIISILLKEPDPDASSICSVIKKNKMRSV